MSGGSLTAEGESDAPIEFEGTTPEPGHWTGILTKGDASVTLDDVVVAHGGGGKGGNLTLKGTSTATVADSTFRGANGYGIYVGKDASLDASNNAFEDNTDGEIGGPGR